MTLRTFAMPALIVTGVLFTLGTLEQATGLFVQTFSSTGAVVVAPDPVTPPPVGVLTLIEPTVQAGATATEATATATNTPDAFVVAPELTQTPAATPTPIETATPATEATAAASPTPEATATASPAATQQPTASATSTPTAVSAATETPTATATQTATPAPSPTAAVPCPAEGIDVRLAPDDEIVRLSVKGEGGFALVNAGQADLGAGATLRLSTADSEPAYEEFSLAAGDVELAIDDVWGAWLLPELAVGASLELTLVRGPAVAAETADVVAAKEARPADATLLAEVVVTCDGTPRVIAQHKLILRAAAVEMTPVAPKPLEAQLIEVNAGASDIATR